MGKRHLCLGTGVRTVAFFSKVRGQGFVVRIGRENETLKRNVSSQHFFSRLTAGVLHTGNRPVGMVLERVQG